jgi:Ca-activated chloride channel family protein
VLFRSGPMGGAGFGGMGGGGPNGGFPAPGTSPQKVLDFARNNQRAAGGAEGKRGLYEEERLKGAADQLAKAADPKDPHARRVLDGINQAREQKAAYDKAKYELSQRNFRNTQSGKLGVDLSVANNSLRNQERIAATANRTANGRQCIELAGVWIDEGFDAAMKAVTIKAQSDAYFRILEKQPKMREVFRLGNYLVWVTPSKTALIVDTSDGKDKLTDAEIDALFAPAK